MTVNRSDVIHAVRVGQAIGERDHNATSTCWCEPSPLLRDLTSGAAIWVHGATGEGDNRLDAETGADMHSPMHFLYTGTDAPSVADRGASAAVAKVGGTGRIAARLGMPSLSALGGGGAHTAALPMRKTAPSKIVHAYHFAVSHLRTATLLCTPTMHSPEVNHD